MNKIYKVIWSKTRNCYVAVSEIAKRNGKSCISENCGAKANRRRVALALLLALSVTSGAVFTMPQVACADGTITVTDAEYPPATLSAAPYGYNVTMYWPTDSSITELNITGGQKYNHVFAGYRDYGTVSGHTVTISGADTAVEVGKLFGGVTPEPSGGANLIENNHVIVYGGKIHGDVSGGSVISYNGGTAKNNTVYINAEVSGDDFTVKGSVFGGFSNGNGNVTGNSVSLINGKVINVDDTGGDVIGGYVGQDGNAGGDGEDEGNKVSISGGTVARSVYGGYVYNGTGSAIKNEVSITGGETKDVFGGESNNGSVIGNKVTIDTTVASATDVSVQRVYGGKGNGSAEITGNEVSIRGSKTKVNIIVESNTVGVYGVYGGYSSGSGTASKNTVTISNEAEVKCYDVYGGYSVDGDAGGTSADEGNTVTVSDSTLTGYVIGGRSKNGNANYNSVTVNNSSLTSSGKNKFVQGGRAGDASVGDGTANFNTVTINGSTITVSGTSNYASIYGGRSTSGKADSNTVTITGTTITTSGTDTAVSIYGGASDNKTTACDNNTVNLLGASVLEGKGSTNIYGSNETAGTGNELHIGGVKGSTATSSDNIWTNNSSKGTNMVSNVSNFDSIVLHDVAWSATIPVIGATGAISNVGALDITNMTIHGSINSGESMSLLSSGNNVSSIKLKYNDGDAVSLVNNPVTIGGGSYTDKVIIADLLKFSGTSAGTVSLATDNKAIVYNAGESSVSSATFSGTADWSTSAALYSNTSYKFDTNATTSLAGLQFNNTTVTEDPMGQTMTLISGNVKGTVSAQPTDASIAVSLTKNNTTLGGMATGEGIISDGNLTYTINGVALDSVAVTAAGDTPDDLPTGWTKGSTVTVDTGTTVLARETVATILTSDMAGLFTGATFSGNNQYKAQAFTSDTAKGVTLDGTQQKGIKASDDGKNLVYAVNDTKDVATITLGTVATNDPRDMSGTGFDFANTTKVDASALELNVVEPLNISSVIPLVTNATGLAAGVAVDYGEGKTGHSQDVPLTHGDTGIVLNATVTGTVATAPATVNYTVTGGTLNSIALDNWNGTAVTGTLAGFSGSGVAVTTGNFTEPTLAAGQSIDIITTTTANFFGSVTGDKVYKKGEAFNDTKNGVTLSGDKYGGVKTNDTKTTLTYYAESMTVDKVTFGEMAWGTGRAAAAGYDFVNVTSVDASGLTFTNPEAATGSMDLLTNATNLAAGAAVDYGTGKSSHSQEFDKTLDNKAIVTATLTGTVDTATAGKVSYTATGTTMSKFDLANWDGATSSAVPTGWALSSVATVETGGMTAPEVEAGKHIDILKSDTDNFFANVTINGANAYDPDNPAQFEEEDGGIQFVGSQSKGVTLNEEKKHIIYAAGTKNVNTAVMMGEIAWKDGGIYYDNTKYNFTDDSETDISGVKFTADTDPLAGDTKGMTLIKNAGGKVVNTGSPEFSVSLKNTTLNATATGTSETGTGNLVFTVDSVTLDSVTVNSAGNDMVPAGWEVAEKLTVDTSKMEVPSDAAYGKPQSVLTANSAIFTDDSITGDNKYAANPAQFTDEDGTGAVEISGKQDAGVKASTDGKSLVYEMGKKEVSAVTLGEVKWAAGAELLKAGSEEYDYTNAAVNNSLTVAYDAPENVAANQSMTLLKANKTLADMAEQEKQHEYKYNDVPGVTVDAKITGKLAAKDGAVTFTAAENKASLLTFEKVEWTGDNPLIDHSKTLKNVSFNGATVDTSNIDFYKEMYIEADQETILVSGFDGKANITENSTKYMVGTAFDGESETKLEGGNLILRTKTAAGVSEQTHKAVMGVEATMGLLATGREHAGKVLDGLGNLSNAGSDGTTVGASIGGEQDRYETGSHVNVNSWSAAVGIGARKEMKKGTLQYGIFGEYGKGNYTLHSDVGRSDGDAHYAGGGLMAKWTNKHDVYTEASFRLGRVSDSANDLLRDGAGNAYGYDIHATYYGAHVGLGKVFNYKGGKSLDVYGKFFYTKRDGAEFDAKQHYNLDSVSSSVLRIGARYGTTDKKWNWYGGLAYEYEFDGESKGTVNGTEIRAASIKGGSVRGEFGMRMDATKNNPWQTDISIYGYGGKHRGFGGSVNVAYTF